MTVLSTVLLAESVQMAVSSRVISSVIAILACAVPLGVSGLAGLAIDSQASILAAVDSAGARLIEVSTTSGEAVLPATAVSRIANLSGVAWTLGLGPVQDVRNTLGSGPAPLRAIRSVGAPVALGTASIPNGVFVSADSVKRVGLAGAYGAVFPGSQPVVGWFAASEPLGWLNAYLLVPSTDDSVAMERILVFVDDSDWINSTATSIRNLIGTRAASEATVGTSEALLAAKAAVNDEIVRSARRLVTVVLVAGMIMACIVVFSGTVGSRRDFGRRRALGATRGQLTLLVMAATLWPTLAGALAGTFAGWAYVGLQLSRPADPRFPVAVGVLTVIGLTAASALPALHAATRDPLRVLRVP